MSNISVWLSRWRRSRSAADPLDHLVRAAADRRRGAQPLVVEPAEAVVAALRRTGLQLVDPLDIGPVARLPASMGAPWFALDVAVRDAADPPIGWVVTVLLPALLVQLDHRHEHLRCAEHRRQHQPQPEPGGELHGVRRPAGTEPDRRARSLQRARRRRRAAQRGAELALPVDLVVGPQSRSAARGARRTSRATAAGPARTRRTCAGSTNPGRCTAPADRRRARRRWRSPPRTRTGSRLTPRVTPVDRRRVDVRSATAARITGGEDEM